MNFVDTNSKVVFSGGVIETVDVGVEGGNGINQEPVVGELKNVFG